MTLSSGKALAEERLHGEKQSKAAAADMRKTKRKALAERGQKQGLQGEQAAATTTTAPGGGDDGDDDAAAAGPGSVLEDLLPPDVLEALLARKRRRPEAEYRSTAGGDGDSVAQRQARLVSEALQSGGVKRRSTTLVSVERGPVTVTVLSAAARRAAAAERGNFRREALLGGGAATAARGGGVKRSHNMLKHQAMGRAGPAAKFI